MTFILEFPDTDDGDLKMDITRKQAEQIRKWIRNCTGEWITVWEDES